MIVLGNTPFLGDAKYYAGDQDLISSNFEFSSNFAAC